MSDDFPERPDHHSPPESERDHGGRQLVLVWVVVSALWVAATLLRVRRVWLQTEDWGAVISSRVFWLDLLLPPMMFAVVFLATYWLKRRRGL